MIVQFLPRAAQFILSPYERSISVHEFEGNGIFTIFYKLKLSRI